MNARIRRYLINFSRQQKGSVSYLTLVQGAELGLNLDVSHEKSGLNEMLAEISQAEHAAGRPILSSLVKVKGSKGQGDSFYKFCERIGLGTWRELKQDPEFLSKLRAECREFWGDDQNLADYL